MASLMDNLMDLLEKENDELEAENKKYAKIFSKLKAAI